ncbi:MAG: hypothetical protein ACRDHZ_24950 [Ktedonobacteraceae bacterium]
MPGQAQDDWHAIAQERWPLYKIEGDGPFVAMPRGEGRVFVRHDSRTVYWRAC